MKIYRPIFSIVVITVQLILSIIDYHYYVEWGKANPALDGLINRYFLGDTLFLFVVAIGFYEMLTAPGKLKTLIRVILICIVLGTQFSQFVPIDDFYFGVYNTAWFMAVVALILIIIRLGRVFIEKKNIEI
ncbi:hypothetical protein POV27_06320 [Aureisphaera galaxeae]|uniref:hypothetical protein n=1 Tax=Aureisphaera galaxeae TaxID=1538023 RepID=UPI002350E2C6|nr:hypothetical protein [Aureisphaera galaxeae]MDC8003659.1 hypothetical protein [Aureisphaera galaxeae]